jgi:hypothetical protein
MIDEYDDHNVKLHARLVRSGDCEIYKCSI